MDSLGVTTQQIDGPPPTLPAYEKAAFEINGVYYVIIDRIDRNMLKKLVSLHKDDEVLNSGHDIFTYIIGTQYMIDPRNKTILREPTSTVCDINKMHIWAKPCVSIQEIETKHSNILNELVENYNGLIQTFQTSSEIDETMIGLNSIDQLYYAGEIKYNRSTKTLNVNFLSGTYMAEMIDCANPRDEVRECVTKFFKEKCRPSDEDIEVIIDTSCKTYITHQMTIEQLDTYVNNGLEVYQFNDKKDAENFKNKNLAIARIKSKKGALENQMKNPRMQMTPEVKETKLNEISQFDAEIQRIESLVGTRYVPQTHGGGKTRRRMRTRTRTRRTRRRTRRHKR
jgi:hypothetical protein